MRFSVAQLPSIAANRLRQSQIRGAIEQMRVFLAGNTFFAPVLSFQAWNTGINSVVLLWTLIILFFFLVALLSLEQELSDRWIGVGHGLVCK